MTMTTHKAERALSLTVLLVVLSTMLPALPVLGAGNIYSDCSFIGSGDGSFTGVSYPSTTIGQTSKAKQVCFVRSGRGYNKCWAGYQPPNDNPGGVNRGRCCELALCNANGCNSSVALGSSPRQISIAPAGDLAWLEMYMGRTSAFAPANHPNMSSFPSFTCSYDSCQHITQWDCKARVWDRVRANAVAALMSRLSANLDRAANKPSSTDGLVMFSDLETPLNSLTYASTCRQAVERANQRINFNTQLANLRAAVNIMRTEMDNLRGQFRQAADAYHVFNYANGRTALNTAETLLWISVNGTGNFAQHLRNQIGPFSTWTRNLRTTVGNIYTEAYRSASCPASLMDPLGKVASNQYMTAAVLPNTDFNDYFSVTGKDLYQMKKTLEDTNVVTLPCHDQSTGSTTSQAQSSAPLAGTYADLFAEALGFDVTVTPGTVPQENPLADDFEPSYVNVLQNETGVLVKYISPEPCGGCALFITNCSQRTDYIENVTIYLDAEDDQWNNTDSLIGQVENLSREPKAVNITSIAQVPGGSSSTRMVTATIFYTQMLCQACQKESQLLWNMALDGAPSDTQRKRHEETRRSVGGAGGPAFSKTLVFTATRDLSLLHLVSVPGLSGPIVVTTAAASGGAGGAVAAGVVVGATIGSVAGAVLLSAAAVGGAVVARKAIINRRRRQMNQPDLELSEEQVKQEDHSAAAPALPPQEEEEEDAEQKPKQPQFSVQVMGNREHAGSLTMRNPVIATTQK